MNRTILVLLAAGVVAACQDATAPRTARPSASPAAAAASAAGAQVAVGNNLFAVVNANGTLASGNGVTSVSASGFGTFEVTFNQNVSQCAYVATTVNNFSQALQVFTASGHASVNGVYVETKNQGGGLTAVPFHLVVSCNNVLPFAVIDYNGALVRSSGGVSVSGSFGIYRITFPQSVAPCAYLATVADPSNGLVFSPAGVYTASGANTSEVYVETKNPGGGVQAGIPFHLMLVCAGAPRTGYAVVKPTGTFQRGSPAGGTIAHPSTGLYTITAPFQIGACAKVLTRGSNNASAPFNPATVEIGMSSTSTKFTAEVRSLLFFGGNLFDEAFHTAVVC